MKQFEIVASSSLFTTLLTLGNSSNSYFRLDIVSIFEQLIGTLAYKYS
jgi:hypothetical protein